jgi:hypothetical protein
MHNKRWTVLILGVLLVSNAFGQAEGLFAKNAASLGFGASALSPNGRVRVSVAEIDSDVDHGYPSILRVKIDGRTLERQFDFGLNAEVLWSPSGARFSVTGSGGGAVGQYRTAIVSATNDGLGWFDATPAVERAFGRPVRCGWPEAPNVGAVAWLSETRLLLAAQIMGHSNCDSFGTFVAYRLGLTSGRVERRYDQLETKKRWRTQLGKELLSAPDECIRTPQACYVSTNHPEFDAR